MKKIPQESESFDDQYLYRIVIWDAKVGKKGAKIRYDLISEVISKSNEDGIVTFRDVEQIKTIEDDSDIVWNCDIKRPFQEYEFYEIGLKSDFPEYFL